MARSTIEDMTDDGVDRPEPPSAKAVTALLREARSLSRRADKLGDATAAVDDPTTQQLATAARTSTEQMVHHLTVLERHAARREGGRSSISGASSSRDPLPARSCSSGSIIVEVDGELPPHGSQLH